MNEYVKRSLPKDRSVKPWEEVSVIDNINAFTFPPRYDTIAMSIKKVRRNWSLIAKYDPKILKTIHWDAIYPQRAHHQAEAMRDFVTQIREKNIVIENREANVIVHVDGVVKRVISVDSPYSSVSAHVEAYKEYCKVADVASIRRLMESFPHPNKRVLQYYDYNGVRLPGVDKAIPLDVGGAFTQEQYAVNAYETELVMLHASCLFGEFAHLPRCTVGDAVDELTEARQARLKWRDYGKRSKRYMCPGPSHNNTVWKFLIDKEYDLVVHPGAGRRDRLSRRAFKAKRIVCIDPASDSPQEKMTFHQYARDNPTLPPGRNLVCSDMSQHNAAGMCSAGTNELASVACQYAFDNGADFMLKVGMQLPDELPQILQKPIFAFFKKARLHNAEIIVTNGTRTLASIFADLAYVVKRSNELRELMTETRQWPNTVFTQVKEFLPQLSSDALQVYTEPVFEREPAAGLFKFKRTYENKERIHFGEATVAQFRFRTLSDIDYDDFRSHGHSGEEFARDLKMRCAWMEREEVFGHVANLARIYGISDEVLLSEVYYQ